MPSTSGYRRDGYAILIQARRVVSQEQLNALSSARTESLSQCYKRYLTAELMGRASAFLDEKGPTAFSQIKIVERFDAMLDAVVHEATIMALPLRFVPNEDIARALEEVSR